MSKTKPAARKVAAEGPAPSATITTTREALLDALAIPARITPKKSTLDPLLYVVLSHRDGEVRVAASDSTMSADVHVAAECVPAAPWRVSVMGRELFDLARRCPPGPVTIDVYDEARVIVRSGETAWTLPATTAQHALPPIEAGTGATRELRVDSDDLAWLLATVRYATGNDPVHPYTFGALLHAEEGELIAVATSGHVLAVAATSKCTSATTYKAKDKFRAMIPLPTVEALAATVGGRGEVILRLGGRTLELSMGPASVGVLLADDQFPQYMRVVPGSLGRPFDAAAWSAEVSRVCLAPERVRLRSDGERVKLLWNDVNGRSSNGSVELGGEHEIAVDVNSAYLLETLGAVVQRPETMTLFIGGERDPVVVRTSNEARRTIAVAMSMVQ